MNQHFFVNCIVNLDLNRVALSEDKPLTVKSGKIILKLHKLKVYNDYTTKLPIDAYIYK